ncbi:SAM-dependent methyltransferase [Alcaligenaceae bacterium SJ-26]|nr:SAM-dependent methyltransferase [Alcaligenaceae bacterium SJ-26]
MHDTAHVAPQITQGEFDKFKALLYDVAGIELSNAKKVLLVGRLTKRLKHLGLRTFGQYYAHVTDPAHPAEHQMMVDLLTTNETFFFREPAHFEFLKQRAAQARGTFRVWSAAASSGEEAYSIAMSLADTLGNRHWEIVGTDISQRVLARARTGHYSTARLDGIPQHLLHKYCLKGINEESGTMLVMRNLRERVRFVHSNLLAPRKDLGLFDVIFLRNVMIYFDNTTKRRVIANLLPSLKSDGCLIIGHSESLTGLDTGLVPLQPTVYGRSRLPS